MGKTSHQKPISFVILSHSSVYENQSCCLNIRPTDIQPLFAIFSRHRSAGDTLSEVAFPQLIY